MPRFSRLTPETAVGASRDLLGDLVERHGQVGDMVSTMAHSPAVLGGYLDLSKAMRRAKLDRKVSELVSIAVQSKQGCGMCLASHISAARSLGVSDDEIALAQQGTAMTGPVAAMIALGLQVYREPTSITDEQIDELRGYGYSDREISDVVGVVSLNILTGAFNLVAGLTPGDWLRRRLGALAERIGSGLQNRLHGFESRRHLHFPLSPIGHTSLEASDGEPAHLQR